MELFERYKTTNKIVFLILVFLIIVWQIPFLNRGIDYTDTGYYLAKYKDAFTQDTIDVSTYMSTMLGGLIYLILPHSHLLVFRILDWTSYLLISLLVYNLFKQALPRNLLLVCILLGNMAIKRYPMTLSYNTFSVLFLLLATNLLYNGLIRTRDSLIFLAGTVVGISIFFRIPNILQVSLLACLIWYYAVCVQDWASLVRQGFTFIIGTLGAVSVVVLIMWRHAGIKNIIYSLGHIMSMAANPDQSHGIVSMLYVGFLQFRSYGYAFFKFICPMVIIVTLVTIIIKRIGLRKGDSTKRKYLQKALLTMTLICSLIMYSILVLSKKVSYSNMVGIIGVGACLVSMMTSILYRHQDHEVSVLSMIVVMIALSMSFGSDNVLGIYVIFMAPLLSGFVFSLFSIIVKTPLIIVRKPSSVVVSIRIFVFTLILTIIIGWIGIWGSQLRNYTYRDSKPEKLKYAVRVPELNGMRTTYDRAVALNEFVKIINSGDLKDYEMIVLGRFPLAFVLAENKNYFSNPWIDLQSVPNDTLFQQINTKNEQGVSPIIVLSHLWENENQVNFFKDNEKFEIIVEYMKSYAYTEYYKSSNFTIYKPN